jgi:activator of 2-hydroxyglutaryl-CoA dehydratase
LAGGILRFDSMGRLLVELLGSNVPPGDLSQFVGALGAAWLDSGASRRPARA